MIFVGKDRLELDSFKKVLFDGEKVDIHEDALNRVFKSYYFLKEFIKDKLIYGINTGFGPMAQYKISHEDQIQLQYNLIRSHCSGSGAPIPEINVKALMLARLNMLLLGYSGIHPDAVLLLKELINKDITPVIYEHGGLGASGDLVQLAHLALTLIGEGDVYHQGKIQRTAEVFKNENIKPLVVHIREGLALMNGTSAMCGIAAVNIIRSKQLIEQSLDCSSVIIELVESYDDHYSYELNRVKPHAGQQKVAAKLRENLKDSKLVKKREKILYDTPVHETILKEKVQEYYSLRCVPQILGPISDTIDVAEQILVDEINSANDNPVIDYENKNVFHGGNFHGDYIGLEMDKLKIAITKLSMLAERQLNFLMNDSLNGIIPPFANRGTLGLNLGVQGVQFVATSTTAENQTLSNPMYIHSIPSNNDNQDIVSMGSNAALITQKVINNTFEVMAIEWQAIIQAVEYLGFRERMSSHSKKQLTDLVKVCPPFVEDAPHYERLRKLTELLKSQISF